MSQGPRKYLKPILSRILKPVGAWYFSKPRKDRYEGLTVDVPAGVFHPKFFFSTRLMLKHLKRYELKGKSLLELGAGSGMIAIWCAREGASVTATDISAKAVAAIQANASQNAVGLRVLHSDLFAQIPEQRFDYVVINPPYYPAEPKNEDEFAWYCGADFGYFRKLFESLYRYRNPDSRVLMVLSEDCNIARISEIAQREHWDMEMIHPDRKWGEWSFIFSLRYKRVA